MNAITTNYRLISNCAILDQTVLETIFCTSSSKILYSSDKKMQSLSLEGNYLAVIFANYVHTQIKFSIHTSQCRYKIE